MADKSAQHALDQISRRGRRVFRPGLTIIHAPLPYSVKPRIVISSKIDKRSVVRHRIKRQIRHILQGADIKNLGLVVVVNKQIHDQSFAQIKTSILSAVDLISK